MKLLRSDTAADPERLQRFQREARAVAAFTLGPPRLTLDGRDKYFSRRVREADIWLLTLQ